MTDYSGPDTSSQDLIVQSVYDTNGWELCPWCQTRLTFTDRRRLGGTDLYVTCLSCDRACHEAVITEAYRTNPSYWLKSVRSLMELPVNLWKPSNPSVRGLP